MEVLKTFKRYDVNNQQDATTCSFVNLFNSALLVSGDKFAHPQEHFFDCIYSFRYNTPTLLPTGARGTGYKDQSLNAV